MTDCAELLARLDYMQSRFDSNIGQAAEDATAAIRELMADLAELQAFSAAQTVAMQRLGAERDALKPAAERFRWLNDHVGYIEIDMTGDPDNCVRVWVPARLDGPATTYRGRTLEDVVDMARGMA